VLCWVQMRTGLLLNVLLGLVGLSACGHDARHEGEQPGKIGAGATGGVEQSGSGGGAGGAGEAGVAGEPGLEPAGGSNAAAGVSGSGSEDAGASGSGGTAGNAACDEDCDDRNACTTDRCEPGGGCVHAPLADGSPCDDRDACTSADGCSNGQCAGEPRESAPSVLGTFSAYGGFREGDAPFQGTSLVLSDELVVFADRLSNGTLLSLVRIEADGTRRLLDQLTTFAALGWAQASSWSWHDIATTRLFSVGPNRFLLTGVPFGSDFFAGVFDVDGGRLIERSRMKERGYPQEQAIGRDGRFFRLDFDGLFEYRVTEAGSIEPVSRPLKPNPITSLEAELSPDGTTLYSAALGGIYRWDVTQAVPVSLDVLWPGQSFVGVEVNRSYLAVEELKANVKGSVLVYHLPELSLVTRFEADLDNQPLGFSLLGQDKIAIEWDRLAGTNRTLTSDVYPIGQNGSELLSELVIWNRCCGDTRPLQPARFAAGHSLLVLAPFQEILRLNDSGDQKRLLAPEQGNLSFVQVLDSTTVAAFDAYSSHAVDISDPAHPRLVSGSTLEQGTRTSAFQVHRAQPGGPTRLLATTQSVAVDVASGNEVTLLTSGKAEALRASVAVRLDGTPSQLLTARGAIFQLSREPGSIYRVRRYALDPAGVGTLPSEPLSDVRISLASAELGEAGSYRFAVDEATGAIALVQVWSGENARVSLHWLEASVAGLREVASTSLATQATLLDIAAERDRVAIVWSTEARVYQLVNDALVGLAEKVSTRDTSQPGYFEVWDLLGFDGTRLFLSERQGVGRAIGVSAFDAGSLQRTAFYPTASWPRSVTAVGSNLVIGGDATLTIAAPYCALR